MIITEGTLYLGKVKLRRERDGVEWPLKPEAECLDGELLLVRAEWQIGDDDRRYPGEWAMVPHLFQGDIPLAWIASGDFVELDAGALYQVGAEGEAQAGP